MMTRKTFRVVSGTATDIVHLGQSRGDVQKNLGRHRTFRRTSESKESDYFIELGVVATYTLSDTVTMLEFASPALVEVVGFQLIGEPLERIEEALATVPIDVERDELGAVITFYNIGLFAPSGMIEGVQLGSD